MPMNGGVEREHGGVFVLDFIMNTLFIK